MWRTFIKKNLAVLSKNDLTLIKEELDKLSPWPWTPKSVTEISKATDLDFAARAPEVISKFCFWTNALIDKIEAVTFAFKITICKNCKYWQEDSELSFEHTQWGKCKEDFNVQFLAPVDRKGFLTPSNFGCVNGKTQQKE